MEWRDMEIEDIPSRDQLKTLILNLLGQGITNSDRMRDDFRQKRRIKSKKVAGHWNDSPSDKFVNEHAWALEDLVVNNIIEKTAAKEYQLRTGICLPG